MNREPKIYIPGRVCVVDSANMCTVQHQGQVKIVTHTHVEAKQIKVTATNVNVSTE